MANGKFVLDKGRTGKYRFNLYATNGRIIATSEAYDSKAAALKGLAAVQRLAAGAPLVDRTNGAAPTKATAKKGTSTMGAAHKSSAKNAAKRASTKATAVTAT